MRSLILLAALSTFAVVGSAQTQQDHAAHHPAGASAPSAAPTATPPLPAAAAPQQMNAKMQSMQAMHDKMMSAKTPEARQALMAEHMKAMQGGMAMMGQMRSSNGPNAGVPATPEAMSRRMDMMEMMMQMMVDREAARTAPGK